MTALAVLFGWITGLFISWGIGLSRYPLSRAGDAALLCLFLWLAGAFR